MSFVQCNYNRGKGGPAPLLSDRVGRTLSSSSYLFFNFLSTSNYYLLFKELSLSSSYNYLVVYV